MLEIPHFPTPFEALKTINEGVACSFIKPWGSTQLNDFENSKIANFSLPTPFFVIPYAYNKILTQMVAEMEGFLLTRESCIIIISTGL